MALANETREELPSRAGHEEASISRQMSGVPPGKLSPKENAGSSSGQTERGSPPQYEEALQQAHFLQQRNVYPNTNEYHHLTSFQKSVPISSFAQSSPSGYILTPPPARSPPITLPPPTPPPPLAPLPSTSPLSSASDSHITSSSFTNTFLRGILSSIDSKDPIVANAWLETLLDAIDLLPPDVIKREVIPIAVGKANPEQSVNSRKSACRVLGKVSGKLDNQTVRQDVLPSVLALCQDEEAQVRQDMCSLLGLVARGIGAEIAEASLLPLLVDLGNDDNPEVRLASIEAVVHLISYLKDQTCTHTIVPLVMKSCDHAKVAEDDTLPRIAFHLGKLCHGLTNNLNDDQKEWFVSYFKYMARLGLSPSRENSFKKGKKGENQPMPDLLPPIELDKSELCAECRLQCAFNFPAMVHFVGSENFVKVLHPTFTDLASDPTWKVRRTLAKGLHEVAKLVGVGIGVVKMEICGLFADSHIEVLEAMVANMVHVIDAMARQGVLQFGGQGGQYSNDLSRALLNCEETISLTRNWRLQADCLEKFSCLANCISPATIMNKFIPLLFNRMQFTRTLPCRVAAARTLLVILRFTVKAEHRMLIVTRICQDLASGKSFHTRMLFLRLCEMALSLFSRQYFKINFLESLITMANDKVPNIRLKLFGILPRVISVLSLPGDKDLYRQIEEMINNLLHNEKDNDVLAALQKALQEMDDDGDKKSNINSEEENDNERKFREEQLIASMENQIYCKSPELTSASVDTSNSRSYLTRDASPGSCLSQSATGRRRSESLPPVGSRTALPDDISSFAGRPLDPLRTYSPDFSVIGNVSSFSENPDLSEKRPNHDMIRQHYSSSLENLDPSAKEFLVDAGVVLENLGPVPSVSSSLPNLTKINHFLSEELRYARSNDILPYVNKITISDKASTSSDDHLKNSLLLTNMNAGSLGEKVSTLGYGQYPEVNQLVTSSSMPQLVKATESRSNLPSVNRENALTLISNLDSLKQRVQHHGIIHQTSEEAFPSSPTFTNVDKSFTSKLAAPRKSSEIKQTDENKMQSQSSTYATNSNSTSGDIHSSGKHERIKNKNSTDTPDSASIISKQSDGVGISSSLSNLSKYGLFVRSQSSSQQPEHSKSLSTTNLHKEGIPTPKLSPVENITSTESPETTVKSLLRYNNTTMHSRISRTSKSSPSNIYIKTELNNLPNSNNKIHFKPKQYSFESSSNPPSNPQVDHQHLSKVANPNKMHQSTEGSKYGMSLSDLRQVSNNSSVAPSKLVAPRKSQTGTNPSDSTPSGPSQKSGVDRSNETHEDANKQQSQVKNYPTLPKRRSLLKPPTDSPSKITTIPSPALPTAKKRLSLTDQMGSISQHAISKLIPKKNEVSLTEEGDKYKNQDEQGKYNKVNTQDLPRAQEIRRHSENHSMLQFKPEPHYKTPTNGLVVRPEQVLRDVERAFQVHKRPLPQKSPDPVSASSSHSKMSFISSKAVISQPFRPPPSSSPQITSSSSMSTQPKPALTVSSGGRVVYQVTSPTSQSYNQKQSYSVNAARRTSLPHSSDQSKRTSLATSCIVIPDLGRSRDSVSTRPDQPVQPKGSDSRYTRVPPPKYRPHPPPATQRRAISPGHMVTAATQTLMKKQQVKSLSAESILDHCDTSYNIYIQSFSPQQGSSNSALQNYDTSQHKTVASHPKLAQSTSNSETSEMNQWPGSSLATLSQQKSQNRMSYDPNLVPYQNISPSNPTTRSRTPAVGLESPSQDFQSAQQQQESFGAISIYSRPMQNQHIYRRRHSSNLSNSDSSHQGSHSTSRVSVDRPQSQLLHSPPPIHNSQLMSHLFQEQLSQQSSQTKMYQGQQTQQNPNGYQHHSGPQMFSNQQQQYRSHHQLNLPQQKTQPKPQNQLQTQFTFPKSSSQHPTRLSFEECVQQQSNLQLYHSQQLNTTQPQTKQFHPSTQKYTTQPQNMYQRPNTQQYTQILPPKQLVQQMPQLKTFYSPSNHSLVNKEQLPQPGHNITPPQRNSVAAQPSMSTRQLATPTPQQNYQIYSSSSSNKTYPNISRQQIGLPNPGFSTRLPTHRMQK